MFYPRFRFRFLLAIFALSCVFLAKGAPLSQETALVQAQSWMSGNPVMSAAAGRSVMSAETFPNTGGYSVYVVQFDPKGY
ncbi:MAG: hypothetical protein ABFR33_09260, partial [Verrucomicrobiota bacterium]